MKSPIQAGVLLLTVVAWLVPMPAAAPPPFTGPWEVSRLLRVPPTTWGGSSGLVQQVYYAGEPLAGQPTRVFAWYGRPASGDGPFPAMLLVHGGGGKAFAEWAEHWAARGYVSLAMDLSGNGPEGRLADGGPDQSDDVKFRDFSDVEVLDMWTYHAVAAVLRGHGLLAGRPEVDPRRIGITGISWGGYLTCIVAGVDPALAVAVPVYGCGFLDQNSCWLESRFLPMTADRRRRWVSWFDPSSYLAGVRCPILFLNGSNDFAYPMDSYWKSFALVPGEKTMSMVIDLPHGHIWSFEEVDAFADEALRGGPPSPRLGPVEIDGREISAAYRSESGGLREARLHYTTDLGPWQQRRWQSSPAMIGRRRVTAELPLARPVTAFLGIQDARGLRVSTVPRLLTPLLPPVGSDLYN